MEQESQQPVALDDGGKWAQQKVAALQDWIGESSRWCKSRLGRALSVGVQKLTAEWDQRLSGAVLTLIERPGKRIALADAAFQRLIAFCREVRSAEQDHFDGYSELSQRAGQELQKAVDCCHAGVASFAWLGGGTRHRLRVFLDRLTVFSRQRFVEELAAAGLEFFSVLENRLSERQRDLTFCRQRLRQLQESLGGNNQVDQAGIPQSDSTLSTHGTDTPKVPNDSGAMRIVLPEGGSDLRQAAAQFLATLTPENWIQLDQALQDNVLTVGKGLYHACTSGGDLAETLAHSFLDVAAEYLGEFLPITDVAQVELGTISTRVTAYMEKAGPLLSGAEQNGQNAFLLVPASEAGTRLGEEAQRAIPSLQIVRVPGQAGLMLCREQGQLSGKDLEQTLGRCREAYEQTGQAPPDSSHARFDICDWMPLN